MKLLPILFLALLAGCGRPGQVRAVTTFVLVQPEWGGSSGTDPVDAQALKFCRTVGATVTSPLFARRVLRARPTLDASVSQIEARLGPSTVLIEMVVTANDRAAAVEAS